MLKFFKKHILLLSVILVTSTIGFIWLTRPLSSTIHISNNNFIFFFDIIEQFDINVLIRLIKEDPYYVVENLFIETMMFMVFYFFVTKRKFGFFSLFYAGFSTIVIKNLGEKFNNNYLFYSANLSFFYMLFFFIS